MVYKVKGNFTDNRAGAAAPIMLGNFQQEDFMQEVLVAMVQTIIIMFVLSMFMDDNHKKP